MNPSIRKKAVKDTTHNGKKELQKGYNEKNTSEPQGAFSPDSLKNKTDVKGIDNKAYKTDKEANAGS